MSIHKRKLCVRKRLKQINASVVRFLKQNMMLVSIGSFGIAASIGITYGLWYTLLYLPLYAGILIWLNWEQYLMGLEMVERQLWGAPLSYYKRKKIPRPKLKFVWRKERP